MKNFFKKWGFKIVSFEKKITFTSHLFFISYIKIKNKYLINFDLKITFKAKKTI